MEANDSGSGQETEALPRQGAPATLPGPRPGEPPPNLELLVHGVGGVTPQDMLHAPRVVRIAGDATAGLYRRPDDVGAESRRGDRTGRAAADPIQEAYCWSGLTSGSGSRALWLLLLPFMFANLAHWMRPGGRRTDLQDLAYDVLVRLLGLTLTVLMVAGACEVAMDLTAWQCAATAPCVRGASWLGFLSTARHGWWSPPGRRLAVAAVVPLALLALLWWLSHRTWRAYESQPPAGTNGPVVPPGESPLTLPGFWFGRRFVARLRAAHTAAGLLTVAAALLLPAVQHDRPHGGWLPAAGIALTVLVAAVSLAAIAVVCRYGRDEREVTGATDRRTARALLLSSAGLLVLAGLYSCWHRAGWTGGGRMPGSDAFAGLTAVQGVFILALAATVWRMRRGGSEEAVASGEAAGSGAGGLPHDFPEDAAAWAGTGREPYRASPAEDRAWLARTRLAAGGYAGPLVAVLAIGLGAVFTGGAAQRIADWLDRGHTPGTHGSPLAGPPVVLSWEAASVPVVLLVVAVVVLLGVRSLARALRDDEARVRASRPGQPDDPSRTRQIGEAVAVAGLTDRSPLLIVAISTSALLLGALSLAGGWATGRPPAGLTGLPDPLIDIADTAQALGSWLLGAAVVALLALGRLAYRNVTTRRTVGILWDVGTYWPRAAHPFAPPCYAERAVPDLTWRIATWTEHTGGRLVLSAHSQGTVLAASAVWQLHPATRHRMGLLTYGAPLERLYGRWFPAYFGQPQLGTLYTDLHDWRNLYRRTDPIGGPILLPPPGRVVDVGPLPDPLSYGRDAAHPLPSPILAHSDYQAEPAFDVERSALLDRISETRPAADPPPGEPGRDGAQGSRGRSSG